MRGITACLEWVEEKMVGTEAETVTACFAIEAKKLIKGKSVN